MPLLLTTVVLLTGLVKPTNMVCSCHHPESKNLEAMSVSSMLSLWQWLYRLLLV